MNNEQSKIDSHICIFQGCCMKSEGEKLIEKMIE